MLTGVFTESTATAENSPKEYGPHWDGFAKRYGIRLTGVGTSNTIEAGLGSIWGEDPRYVLAEDRGFGHRVGHIVLLTFAARNREGQLRPAYARFIAIPGGNFLSNTWRADSVATNRDGTLRQGRVGGGGGGRPDFAEAGGKQPENIDQMLTAAPDVIQKLLI